ncbi:MAG: PAS domain-containing sensor histidine kinase [Bacteroidales bacterium]|nr:PAS domain-containing sensor histidine kinase [Bacteroidales bacterium]
MIKVLYSKISEKFWKDLSEFDKAQLFQLLFITAIAQLISILIFVSGIVKDSGQSNILCNAGLVMVASLALICVLNGKKNCVLYILFTLPVFIYAYNISDFINHPSDWYNVYNSGLWLIAGAFLIMYFSGSDSQVFLYFLISVFTIGLQLHRSASLYSSINGDMPIAMHPLAFYILFFFSAFLLRSKYRKLTASLAENLKSVNRSISEVVRTSHFPVIEIKVGYDDEGNAVNFTITKVNNAFEAAFNINNYEVVNQDADFIFDLVFHEHFDIYRILIYDNKKTDELHLKKLERWYKIHTLHPNHEVFYLILEDITKIKKRLAELEISKKRYKVLLEAIPDMFFVIGKDGTYEDFVIKESDLFKVEDANIVGSTIFDIGFPENMAEKIFQCIQNCLTNNSIETVEYSLKTPNGTYLFEMRLAKLNARSVISVARDITRRKNAEFSLEKAKKKAEESDRLKSVFLTNLSHEIRTPIHIITNFTRMLTEGGLKNSERTELSDAIIQNGKQLMNMINNTIHLSKIETGTVEVSYKFCEVNTLIKNLYNHYNALIPESRPVKLLMYLDVPNPAFGFKTDSHLLKEILELLIDNAIKYTLKGEILIKYEMERNEQVIFTVSDTGIGIQQEEINNIFSRFYRIKNEINDTTSGSGIGLPIAKQFIQLLGGELTLNTKPGKGTTISFSLPFKEGEGYLRVVS